MREWKREELDRIGAAREIEVAATRPDGSLGKPVIVWAVRHQNDLYLRSYRGSRGIWYQRALARPHGRISLDGVGYDVAFEHIGPQLAAEIDAAYRDKYGDLPTYVAAMVDESVRATTLRLVPTRR